MRNVGEGQRTALACILFLFVLCGSARASNPEITAVLDDDGRVTVDASFTDECEPWEGYVQRINIRMCPGDYTCCWECRGVAGAEGYNVTGVYNASKGQGGTLTFVASATGGRWRKTWWGKWYCSSESFEASTKIQHVNENRVNFVLPDDDFVSGEERVKVNYDFTHFKDGVDNSSVDLRVCPGEYTCCWGCEGLGRLSDAGKSGTHEGRPFEFKGEEGKKYTLVATACRDLYCSETKKVVKVKPVPCKPQATVKPASVYPQKTYPGTAAIVTVTLEEKPSSACTIELDVVAVDGTGGHSHSAGRDEHTGGLSKTVITFDRNDTGPETVTYTSNEVSGTEKIKYRFLGKTEWNDLAEVEVKVPDLEPFFESEYCRLTGQTGTHPSNHHATVWTKVNTWQMCHDYYDLTETTLGINDMSLIWGGVFDLKASWTKPHSDHRIGKGVDIDRRVWDETAGGYVYKPCYNDKYLISIVRKNDGTLICECENGTTDCLWEQRHLKHVNY